MKALERQKDGFSIVTREEDRKLHMQVNLCTTDPKSKFNQRSRATRIYKEFITARNPYTVVELISLGEAAVSASGAGI